MRGRSGGAGSKRRDSLCSFCASLVAGWYTWCLWFVLGFSARAEAIQVHPASEGLYAHQIAHFFFVFSMGILIYWLRERRLVKEDGWRFVQYACFFFILWNLGAAAVHTLDDRSDLFATINSGAAHGAIRPVGASKGLALFYYLLKMDHLLLLPAIVFLYMGLRRLLRASQRPESRESRP